MAGVGAYRCSYDRGDVVMSREELTREELLAEMLESSDDLAAKWKAQSEAYRVDLEVARTKLEQWAKRADAAVEAYKTRVLNLTEALAAAERERDGARTIAGQADAYRDAAEARVQELTEALAAAEAKSREGWGKAGWNAGGEELAQARVRELEAERDAELRVQNSVVLRYEPCTTPSGQFEGMDVRDGGSWMKFHDGNEYHRLWRLFEAKWNSSEQQLATANALLRDVLDESGIDWSRSDTRERIEMYLSAQPAAPKCNYVGRCNSSRCPKHGTSTAPTDHERADTWEERADTWEERAHQAEALHADMVEQCRGLRAELDAAWKAVASPVKGWVPLAEVIESKLTTDHERAVPPYAVLADGTTVPLMNCPECCELGRADMAHYHSCPDVKTNNERAVLEAADRRSYKERACHAENLLDAVFDAIQSHVETKAELARRESK